MKSDKRRDKLSMNEISTNAFNETILALSREVILLLFVQVAKVTN